MDNQAKFSERVITFLRTNLTKKQIIVLSVLGISIISFYFFAWKAPYNFPTRQIIKVEEGMSLAEVSRHFKEKNIVSSDFWLGNFVILFAGEKKVIARDYYFEKPLSVLRVALLLTRKNYTVPAFKITVPEGLSVREIADIYADRLIGFNRQTFVEQASVYEGYLFPDTYFFFPTTSETEVINKMRQNFDSQINNIKEDIDSSGKSLEDIVKMASILELEGNNAKDRAIISGILWKRIKIGMALQVDASFVYINNKGTSEITSDDLKIDSPYNSYKYRGLPPGPISNPGIESLRASARPTQTPYLYYLSDNIGQMHYAKDFEEHKRNKRIYLD